VTAHGKTGDQQRHEPGDHHPLAAVIFISDDIGIVFTIFA
jgi:hypothetical protein